MHCKDRHGADQIDQLDMAEHKSTRKVMYFFGHVQPGPVLLDEMRSLEQTMQAFTFIPLERAKPRTTAR